MSKLDELDVIRTIGRGIGSKVKLVYDTKRLMHHAAKIIKYRDDEYYRSLRDQLLNESNNLQRIVHPNVVSIINWSLNGVYVKKTGGMYECIYIILELCANGDLFDMINGAGKISENVVRGLFHQLISGLEACHNIGITHRDLKCENILFDQNFNLKISDFGFSTTEHFGNTKGKNDLFMAPEMMNLQQYNPIELDIFASGVILFIMTSKNPPFVRAVANDPRYKYFVANDSAKFWQRQNNTYSDEFKSLIEGLFKYDPTQRLTIDQIKLHPWYLGEVSSYDEIASELSLRKISLQQSAEQARQLRVSKGNRGIIFSRGRFYRGEISEAEELSLSFSYPPDLLSIEKLSNSFNTIYKYSQFITGLLPHEVMTIISHTLASYDSECEASSDCYKVKVRMITYTDSLYFKISIYECENDLYLVDFRLISGNHFDLIPIFNSVLDKVNLANTDE